MEFLVLGPIGVHSAGDRIHVGGVRQRSILALLIANRGHAVSTDRIAEDIYGEDAAAGARRSVQTAISAMRRDLGDAITGTSDGYLFDAPRDSVDANRFEDTVTAGVDMLERSPNQAAVLLKDALGLWRGEPYADVDGQAVFEPEIIRLSELHTTALEARIEADLACGRHRQMVPELEALTIEYPLRERLWGLLMVALYRSGRQADALRTYQQLRGVLGEELGIDPSTEIQALEEQILLQDPALDLVPLVPHNLPAQLTSFVGRERELSEIATLLTDTRLVTLVGTGGSGKTRLAIELARNVLDDYPDGVWLVDLRNISDPVDLAALVASTLQVVVTGDRPITDQLAGALWQRKLLLILDNCEHVLDEAASFIEQLLSRQGSLRILTTTRQSLAIPGEPTRHIRPLQTPRGITVGELAESEAVQLFADRALVAWPDFSLDDAAVAVCEICRITEGLPLALELAAARLRAFSPQELADQLADQLNILRTEQRTGDLRHATIEATIQWSWDLLNDAEQAFLSRLSVFRGTWSLESASEVCGYDDVEPGRSLYLINDLISRSLVAIDRTAGVSSRYRLLEPIRQYAARQLDENGTRELRDRLVSHWRDRLAGAYGPEVRFAWRNHEYARVLEADQANLTAAADWALAAGRFEDALIIFASPFGDLMLLQGSSFETVTGWMRVALEHRDAIATGVLLSALETASEISDAVEAYEATRDYANVGIRAARTAEERHWFQLAAALATQRYEGHAEATSTVFQRIATEAKDPGLRASALFAEAFNARRRQAWPLTRQAMELMSDETPLLWDECRTAFRIFDVAEDSGHYTVATQYAQHAIDLGRRIGWHRYVSQASARLALLYAARGRLGEATTLISEAEAAVRQILDPSAPSGQFMSWVSRVSRLAGDLDQAQRSADEALSILRTDSNPWRNHDVLLEMALISRDRGQLIQASATLDRADRSLANVTHTDLLPWLRIKTRIVQAGVALRQDNPERAVTHLNVALAGCDEAVHMDVVEVVDLTAIALALQGRARQAVLLVGAIDAERVRTGLIVPLPDVPLREKAIDSAQSMLDQDWETTVESGRAMTLEGAAELAHGYVNL